MTARRLLPGILGGLLAAALPAQEASLASDLPAETLFYLELPDVQTFIQNGQSSALGRMYRDPEMQEFAGGLVKMIHDGWAGVRQQTSAMGVPEGLTHWDALRSFELGIAFGPGGVVDGEYQPSLVFGVAFGMKGDLAEQTLGFLGNLAAQSGKGTLSDGPDGKVLTIGFEGDEKIEIRARGSRLVGWSKIGSFGPGNLQSSAKFAAARSAMQAGGGALFCFIDPASGLNAMCDMVSKQHAQAGAMMRRAFAETGLTALQYIAATSGWSNGESVSRSVVQSQPGVPNPMMAANGPKVDKGLAAYVPDNAVSFSLFVSQTDDSYQVMRGLWTELKHLEVQPGQTLGAMWEGFQPGHPLYEWMEGSNSQLLAKGLQGFGDHGFSYTLPSAGGMMGGPGGGGMFLRLDDADAVRQLLATAVPQIAQMLNASKEIPLELEVKTVKITEKGADGQTISKDGPQYYTLKFQTNELPGQMRQMGMFLTQMQPSFGVSVDGWFVGGMNRLSVSNALKKGVTSAEKPITGKPEVQNLLGRVPANTVSLAWSDPRPGIEQMVAMAQGMLPMVAGQIPQNVVPVDLNKLPGPKSFTQYMRPTETYTVVEPERMVTYTVGSFNGADLIYTGGALLAAAPPIAMHFMPAMRGGEPHAVPPPQPQGGADAAAVDSQRQAVLEELERLATGLVVYKDEYGRYPAALGELVKPTDTWAYGFLPERRSEPKLGLVPDPWGQPYHYVPQGDAYQLYSFGPNGVNDAGAGDDVRLVD